MTVAAATTRAMVATRALPHDPRRQLGRSTFPLDEHETRQTFPLGLYRLCLTGQGCRPRHVRHKRLTADNAIASLGDPRAVFIGLNAVNSRPGFLQSGDIAYTPGPQFAVVWASKALVSTPGDNVRLVPLNELADGTEFWRLPNE